jgi:hypothetical protein
MDKEEILNTLVEVQYELSKVKIKLNYLVSNQYVTKKFIRNWIVQFVFYKKLIMSCKKPLKNET